MRKINDYYSKKAKKDKYPARSVYKLEEVQQRYKFLKKGDSVLDLGCYPGSWSLYASEVVGPKGIVVGVDLQQADKSPRAGGSPIHWLCQDITGPELLPAVRRFRPGFRDKWTDAQKSLLLVRHSLELADELLLNRGHYLCKAFQGEDFPEFVKEVKKRFAMAKVLKPQSSRIESREVFLLAMDFRKN